MGDTDVFKNLLKMFIAKIHDESGTDEGKAYRFQTELKDGTRKRRKKFWPRSISFTAKPSPSISATTRKR